MTRLIAVFSTLLWMATGAVAQAAVTDPVTDEGGLFRPAAEASLDDFLWTHRPVLVFADSENDPRFQQQMEYLATRADELAERDVVVLVDSDPATGSEARDRMRPRGFMLVLMSKDGEVYLRKPFPWDVREIMRSIDKMPLRQQELREAR
ncbi:DUF4174 domain-containing protein [Mesobacterium pallidum]|uniref:DUF4174 domain-containing protein n=1 Tax=Mesobacterium pallidum TaxID=2872037 RepID=UPI001EE2D2D5|nr:DUF4174 domain-containing protein [Mesobacterium pallidum]